MSIEELKRAERLDENRIEILKELFPEAFGDGKLNIEVLREEIEGINEEITEESTEEYYGLQWVGKKEARKLAFLPPQGTLSYLENDGINEAKTKNFLIEGDNLEVLRLLQKSYTNKVKLINIDPPYNTGSDFVYKDDFNEPLEKYLQKSGQADEEGLLTSNPKSNGRFHSNWLSMMYPRLKLAKNLLTKDGVLLVNIDEHEIHNLIHLLVELFGEENNLGTIVWDKKNPKGDSTTVAIQHEYIVCFAKNKDAFVNNGGMSRKKANALRMLKKANDLYKKIGKSGYPEDLLKLSKKYDLPKEILQENEITYDIEFINNEFNSWIKKQDNLSGGESAYSKIDEQGQLYQPVSMAWPNKKKAPDDYFIPLIHPKTGKECPVPERGWRNPSETMKKLLDAGEILFGVDESTQPRRKYLLTNNLEENVPSVLAFGGSDDTLFNEMGLPFENPKPYKFVKQLISYITKGDDIILDFFGGSGTTGHAVVEANREDGDNRSFILVQIPEPIENQHYSNIAEITIDRLKKSLTKINEEDKEEYGFAVLKLKDSNIRSWKNYSGETIGTLEQDIDLFTSKPIVENANVQDIVLEFLIHQGYPLDSSVIKVNKSDNILWIVSHEEIPFSLVVCLDENLREETGEYIANDFEKATFICLDNALTNKQKVLLSETMNVKTI